MTAESAARRSGLVVGLLLALAIALGLALAAPVALAGEDTFEWSGVLERGKTLEIRTVNGQIHAESARGRDVEVTATKRWKRSDPDDVTIEVHEHRGGVTICTLYGRSGSCSPGRDRGSNTRNSDVSVDYVVKVPAGVRLEARGVNGNIEVTSLRGPVDAATVNGSIDISTSEHAEATTVNGSIVARLGSSRWNEDLMFRTVNGRIDLHVRDDLSANVHCRTLNGGIETDLPLRVVGRFGPKSMKGRIGDGGGRLSLETVNGAIRLRSDS